MAGRPRLVDADGATRLHGEVAGHSHDPRYRASRATVSKAPIAAPAEPHMTGPVLAHIGTCMTPCVNSPCDLTREG
jgi:hypothetical protein